MKVKRTTEGLRNALFDELDNFLSGKVDAAHVNTVTRATGAILSVIAKDIQYAQLINDMNRNKEPSKQLSDLRLNILLGDESESMQIVNDSATVNEQVELSEEVSDPGVRDYLEDTVTEQKTVTYNGSIIQRVPTGYKHISAK